MTIQESYNLAKENYERNNHAQALNLINEVLAVEDASGEALQLRCYIRYMLEDYEGALTDCNAALEALFLKPPADLYYTRSLIQYHYEQYYAALEDIEEALKIGFDAEKGQALQLLLEAVLNEKIQAYRAWKEGNAIYRLAEEKEKYDTCSAAIEKFSFVISIDENFLEAYLARASAHSKIDNYVEAEADYSSALALGYKDKALILFERGQVRYQLKKFDDALKDFQNAFDLINKKDDEENKSSYLPRRKLVIALIKVYLEPDMIKDASDFKKVLALITKESPYLGQKLLSEFQQQLNKIHSNYIVHLEKREPKSAAPKTPSLNCIPVAALPHQKQPSPLRMKEISPASPAVIAVAAKQEPQEEDFNPINVLIMQQLSEILQKLDFLSTQVASMDNRIRLLEELIPHQNELISAPVTFCMETTTQPTLAKISPALSNANTSRASASAHPSIYKEKKPTVSTSSLFGKNKNEASSSGETTEGISTTSFSNVSKLKLLFEQKKIVQAASAAESPYKHSFKQV